LRGLTSKGGEEREQVEGHGKGKREGRGRGERTGK